MNQKVDKQYIHILRAIACLMVICMHSVNCDRFVADIDSTFSIIVKIGCVPCVPLFFMITGALILPNRLSPIDFWKKRMPRIVFPLIFWGGVYTVLRFLSSDLQLLDFFRVHPLDFPLQGDPVLWYLWMLIGLYLIIPYLNSEMIIQKNTLALFLLFWLISSVTPILEHIEPLLLGKNPYHHNFDMFIYFSGYIGYMFAGKYIDTYMQINKTKTIILVSGTFFFSMLIVIGVFLKFNICVTFLNPLSIVLTLSLFILFRNMTFSSNSIIIKGIYVISKHSYGMYLCHIMIYMLLVCPYLYKDGASISNEIISIFSVAILALGLSYLLSKLPYKKYIIG